MGVVRYNGDPDANVGGAGEVRAVTAGAAAGAAAPVRTLRDTVSLALRATWQGFVDFYSSNNLTFAASIAYYTLLSLFPFLFLVLSLVSRLAVGSAGDNGEPLIYIIVQALPRRFEFLTSRVEELAAASINLSVATTVVSLWAAMGVFGAVTSAINHAWGVERDYGFFTHKLVAFLMMIAAGVLTIVTLLLSGTVEVMNARFFSGVLARFPELQQFSGFLYRNATTPMFIVIVGLVYYFIPNAKVRLRDVWFGAVLAGLLWRLTFAGFSWYVRDLSRFSVHGSVAAVVVFMVWIYISAVILLYGAGVTAAYARLRKHLPQDAPAAPPLTN
jgi:membrane protein